MKCGLCVPVSANRPSENSATANRSLSIDIGFQEIQQTGLIRNNTV